MKRSQLKRGKGFKHSRTGIKAIGKKGRMWSKVRAELKVEFEKLGITRCELGLSGCMGDDGLGFAHSKKRRFIKADDKTVALLCNHCHDQLEVMPHGEMERVILEIIARRERLVA